MKRQNLRIVLSALLAVVPCDQIAHAWMQKQQELSATELVEQFKSTAVFWKQFEVAKQLVLLHDTSVLRDLTPFLTSEDRHLRGNVAFVFARLGESRGFDVIVAMLNDRSDRQVGQGIPGARWTLREQIRADRYYAAHLLGDLKDRRAVPILIPLLRDPEVNSVVPWALGEIGDKSAIQPLADVLGDKSLGLTVRAGAVKALEQLGVKKP